MLADTLQLRQRFSTVRLAGFQFADMSKQECVELIVSESLQGRGGWVVTANTDFLCQAYESAEVRSLYREADLMVADGMPLIWASWLQGTPLTKGRVCGSDLIFSLPAACAREDLSIFLLGGVDDVASRTQSVLTARYPGLRIAGKYSPPFGFEKEAAQYDAMHAAIREAQPDVVLVALGAPKSERLVQVLRSSAPIARWMGVGASFEFASGARRRAPAFMQRLGAEWLFRMAQDPRRLLHRYLRRNLPYLQVLFRDALRKRFPARGSLAPEATGVHRTLK
jgi:N-acetylglucosaminyldiphosphoundecaprenol N-acetyl-beta-D-mannosaminyltransferase